MLNLDCSKYFNNNGNVNKFKNQHLKILHHNILHLESRLDILQLVLDEIDTDIIVLTEHKMKESEISRVNLNNFEVKSYYTRTLTSGGGVLILSKPDLNIKEKCIPAIKNITLEKVFECAIIEIKVNNQIIVLAGIYRTPRQCFTSLFFDKLNVLLEILNEKYEYVVVAGDINIDVLENNKDSSRLKNIVKSHSMFCSVNFPTRIGVTKKVQLTNLLQILKKIKLLLLL